MASAWETTGQKFGEALESGTQASITGINRQWAQKLYEVKKQRRDKMFAFINESLMLGSNIMDNVRKNREGIEFAESQGLGVDRGNWINRAFGKPSFYGSEKTYSLEDVLARKAFDIDFKDTIRDEEEKRREWIDMDKSYSSKSEGLV